MTMNRTDVGEVFDLVRRRGPVSHAELMDEIHTYSSDEVFDALLQMEKEGTVERLEGSIEEHGTTRDLWVAVRQEAE